jgi:CRISPR system Cascade subunit CasA
MNIENRYNLLDEKFIPLKGRSCSLIDVFSEKNLPNLHCNSVQNISLTKLFLAIAQAAYTPKDDEDWANLPNILPQKCVEYLEKWRDYFFLYGEKPFLQMPQIRSEKELNLTAMLPEVSTGNTPLFFDSQLDKPLTDEEKAILMITLSGFAIGGKGDNAIVISKNYGIKTNAKGNKSTEKFGPLLGRYGYLHTFFQGDTLFESIWYNILTLKDMQDIAVILPKGIGKPPWEAMPVSENDGTAMDIKNSLMGSLIPMSKFYSIDGDLIHITDGIDYPSYKDGGFCTTISINRGKKEKDTKVLCADTEKLPWRELTSILSFLGNDKNYENFTIIKGRNRILTLNTGFIIWSGGLKVSDDGFRKQYLSGLDDYIESETWLESRMLKTGGWYLSLEIEMKKLEELQKNIYAAIKDYYKKIGFSEKNINEVTRLALSDFWERSEMIFDDLLSACYNGTQKNIRERFRKIAEDVYNVHCPRETARQLSAWAACGINYAKYLDKEKR